MSINCLNAAMQYGASGFFPINLDALTLEQLLALRYTFKRLVAYSNERAKLLAIQWAAEKDGTPFEVRGALSIRGTCGRVPEDVFRQARGCLLGMAHIYNGLPEWARWEKAWRWPNREGNTCCDDTALSCLDCGRGLES